MIDGSVGNLNTMEPVAGAMMGISLSRVWRTLSAAGNKMLATELQIAKLNQLSVGATGKFNCLPLPTRLYFNYLVAQFQVRRSLIKLTLFDFVIRLCFALISIYIAL